MVGGGDRSDKIRTYNFPQDRVTDHRIRLDLSALPRVLDGDIDRLIDALVMADQAERLSTWTGPMARRADVAAGSVRRHVAGERPARPAADRALADGELVPAVLRAARGRGVDSSTATSRSRRRRTSAASRS